MPHTEPCEWRPPNNKGHRPPSATLLAIQAMLVGQSLRVFHDDIKCTISQCSLMNMLHHPERTNGKIFRSYHEGRHVAVVTRIK